LAALAAAALPVHATTYTPGEFVTFEARVWGAAPDGANAATFLFNNFDAAFPQLPAESILSGDHYLAVGVPESDDLLGPHGLFGLSEPDPPFSMVLDSAFGVNYYLETATGVAADHDAPLGPRPSSPMMFSTRVARQPPSRQRD
jgi:hypothetical protein